MVLFHNILPKSSSYWVLRLFHLLRFLYPHKQNYDWTKLNFTWLSIQLIFKFHDTVPYFDGHFAITLWYLFIYCFYDRRSIEALEWIQKFCCRQFRQKQGAGFSIVVDWVGESSFFRTFRKQMLRVDISTSIRPMVPKFRLQAYRLTWDW